MVAEMPYLFGYPRLGWVVPLLRLLAHECLYRFQVCLEGGAAGQVVPEAGEDAEQDGEGLEEGSDSHNH